MNKFFFSAIACCLNRLNVKKAIVGVDGSTYKFNPMFNKWTTDKARELVDESIEFQILLAGDGSGKGAALVAAIAERHGLGLPSANRE